jgi:hypothetical protein
MPTLAILPNRPARGPAVAATLAVHLLLVALWFGAQAPRPDALASGPRIQWIDVAVPVRVRPPVPAPAPAAARAAATVRGATVAITPTPPVGVAAEPAPAPPAMPAVQPDPAPARSGADVLAQARRDIGKIAGPLGKESPGQFHAPLSSAQSRLAAGIDSATRAPRIYEAPQVTVVQDQGGYDRRIYKVKGALGTYCITVESNHAPDGLDAMKRGIQQKIMTCPREE